MLSNNRHRLALLIAVALAVLAVRFAGTLEMAFSFQRWAGYYFVLLAFLCWIFAGVSLVRGCRPAVLDYCKQHWSAAALALAATIFMQVHEPHALRVLHDESTHAAEALTMHLEKSALIAGKAHYVGATYLMGNYYATFRQYLFPLLVSLLHDLTGYRVSNVFILNGFLGFATLIAAYVATARCSGRTGGWAAMTLLSALPLLAQNVTSGGYDVLNLALVALLFCCALYYFLEEDSTRRLLLLNFGTTTAILLALSRYESVIYLVLWALVVACKWRGIRAVELSRFAVISPFFVLPNLVSHLILFKGRIMDTGPRLQPGHHYFELGYLKEHVPQALYYFFQVNRQATNNVLLSAAGLVGLCFLLVVWARNSKAIKASQRLLLVFAIWAGLVYLIMLTQYWSSPMDILAARFTLTVQLFAAICAGWFVQETASTAQARRAVMIGLAVWVVAMAGPASSQAYATSTMVTSRAERWMIEQADRYDKTRTLFAAASNVHLLAYRKACLGTGELMENPAKAVVAIKAQLYDQILIFQSLTTDPATGGWKPRERQDLGSLVVEEVTSNIVAPTYKMVLWRLVGYRNADGKVVDGKSDDPAVQLRTHFASFEEAEAYRLSLYP